MSETVLVTAALPYANGSIHLGHLVEYVLTDVYVRALRMTGKEALFICADDTHGTPIELNARKAGVTPESFVERFAKEHVEDFDAFEISFDSFHSTNSEENRKWVLEIFSALDRGGHIQRRPLEQLYDEQAQQFLPDRFVKGACPNCGASDQYGDVCEVCGKTYEPTDLQAPYSVLTGSKPVLRSSDHLFVRLSDFTDFLREWTETPETLQPSVRNFVKGWIEGGLRDWCISRDAPYFGFQIPGEPGKFFYVWVDAPIGYISSTDAWAQKRGTPERVDDLWRAGNMRLVHVIGKDIVYFHTLFWPAMLKTAGLKVPDRVHVHGFLTVEGEKMSKTRGTFVNARTFREHLDPMYLRWFYASRLGPSSDDIDLSAEELSNIVNAELVNNLANLVSRGAKFLASRLGGAYAPAPAGLEAQRPTVETAIARAVERYEAFDLAGALSAGLELATLGNRLFQEGEPWKVVKEDPERARDLVTSCLNLARAAVVLVAPAVPGFARRAYAMLGLEGGPQAFEEAARLDLVERPVGRGDVLAARIGKKDLERVFEASKVPEPASEAAPTVSIEPIAGEIDIDGFTQVDLRVGHVRAAKSVEGAKKLLELSVDLGEGRLRTIFAGIAQAYRPEDVEGRLVVVVANLKPRKMRFGTSEGMVLAAGPGGKDLQLVEVADGAQPGSKVS
jgi:methionyl-tRNA synthetase